MTAPYTPAPIVEVAFGYGPFDEVDPGDWTDITEDVFEVTVQRGRSSEFDAFPASTATVSLYNDDRTYDPLNLSGPYVESVRTGVPYIVTQNTKSGTSLGSNNSMNMPSGINAGDLLIAIVSENLGTTSITASAGWTQVQQGQVAGGSTVREAVFAKIAAGSDTLSLSGGTEDYACLVVRIIKHGVSTIGTDIKSSATSNIGVSDVNTGGLSGLESLTPYLILQCIGCNDDNETSPWAPTSYQEVALIESAQSTSSTMLMVASKNIQQTATTISVAEGNFRVSAAVSAEIIALAIPGEFSSRTQLKPNTPIRIMADLASDGVFPVWRGVVDGWPGTYSEGGFRNEVEIACTDVFKVLAERLMPDTLAEDVETLSVQPYTWIRGDLSPSGQLVDYKKHSKNGMLLTPIQIGESVNNGISPKSLEFSDGQSGGVNQNVAFPVAKGALQSWQTNDDLLAGTTWAWSALVRFNGVAASGASVRLMGTTASTGELLIYVNVSDVGTVSAFANGVGANLTVTPAPGISSSDKSVNLLDGKLHHVFVLRIATSLALWIDGTVVATTSNGSATNFFNTTGALITVGLSVGATPGFVMSDVMFFPQRTFLTAEIPTLYQALTVGFGAPRLTGEVINDVLDLIDWPASMRAIDDGELIISPPGNTVGLTALELLQKITESEQGRLFIDAEGNVVFHDRYRTLNETTESTLQYTFSDSGSDVGTRDGTLQVTLDDRFNYEAASVTRKGGVEQMASVTSKPARTRSIDGLYLSDDNQALALAEWIVFRYGVAQPRTESWEIDPETRPQDWADILGLEIGHRIKHDVTPGNIGSSLELEQHVEVIEHEITPEQWIITMNGAPVDANEYFLWDTTQTTDLDHGWDAGVWG